MYFFTRSTQIVTVPPGANLATMIAQYGQGVTFMLPASIAASELTPKNGQAFVGPCKMDGGKKIAHAFTGAAADVQLIDLHLTNYNPPEQEGAVQAPDSTDWMLERVEVSLCSQIGVRTGDGMESRWGNYHDNGNLGMGGAGRNLNICHNSFANNNGSVAKPGASDPMSQAGDIKLCFADNATVEDNEFAGSGGPNIWLDIGCVSGKIRGNTSTGALVAGIFYEIGFNGEISGNVITGVRPSAGNPPNTLFSGAGIYGAMTSGLKIFGNTVAQCFAGIGLRFDKTRGTDPRNNIAYLLQNAQVTNNCIVQGAGGSAAGIIGFQGLVDPSFSARGNIFQGNRYVLDPTALFEWGSRISYADWVKAGNQ